MFGVNNAATAMLAPQFGMGAAGMVAGAAVPAAALAGVTFMANNAARGMQEFSGTQAILSQMRFANPAAAGGRGFTTQQQLGMFNMMSKIDAADPFTSMGDVQSMLRGFNDMKMSQGIRDAQEFSDKFKKMTETIKDMAKMMGTTIEGAMQSFGEMRRAGFVSGADLRGNVVDMMIAQGRGIDQGQFLAAQQGGASTLRARGMTGRFGARMVSGVSSAVMGGMQRNLFSGEELMDIFDTSSAGEASLQFGREMTDVLSNFMMTGQGQAFLAATAERGPGGKFTGKLSQQRLTELLRGGNVPEALSQASAAIQGGGRETQLSFMNNKTALANEFMSRDSAVKDVVDMVRQYAERGGVGGDDGTKHVLKTLLGIDGQRAEMMMKVAKDYEAEATAKLKAQMQELGAEQTAYQLKTRGTFAGIKQYVSGTFSDLGVGIREGSAGIMARAQQSLQGVQDYFAGIERTPLTAETASAGGAMIQALAAPINAQSFGMTQEQLARRQQALAVMQGGATQSMFSGDLTDQDRSTADAALRDPSKRSEIEGAIRRAQLSRDPSAARKEIQRILGTGITSASTGDVVGYVMSAVEGGKAVLASESQSKGIGSLFFGGAKPLEQALADVKFEDSRWGADWARSDASRLFTGEGGAQRLAMASALSNAGLLGEQNAVDAELIRLDNAGLIAPGTSKEDARRQAAQSLMDQYTKKGTLTKEMGSVEDLLALDKFQRDYGGVNASRLFSAAAVGQRGELQKEALAALYSGTTRGIFGQADLTSELDAFAKQVSSGQGLGGFEAILQSSKLSQIGAESDPLLRMVGELGAKYRGIKPGSSLSLEQFAKQVGADASVLSKGVSPERLQKLLEDNSLTETEQRELFTGYAAGLTIEDASVRKGGAGVVFDKENPQPAINDQIYNNLASLTEQNRLNLQVAQSKAGVPVVATPGTTVIR